MYYLADGVPQVHLRCFDSRRNSEQRSNDDGLKYAMKASLRSSFISPSNSGAHTKMKSSAHQITKDQLNEIQESQNSQHGKLRNAFPQQKPR